MNSLLQLKRMGKVKETPDDAYVSASTAFLVKMTLDAFQQTFAVCRTHRKL